MSIWNEKCIISPSLICLDMCNLESQVRVLESCGIQTRMLFAGNIIRHPCFDEIRGTDAYRVVGDLKNTEIILNRTFWLGMYPGMTKEKLSYMARMLHEALES